MANIDSEEKLFHLPPSTVKRMLHKIFALRDDTELNNMSMNFEKLKAANYPTFDPLNYPHLLTSQVSLFIYLFNL